MDRLSIVGIFVAILAIYIGFSLDGGAIASLFELPAFIIVFGGTLGAVMLQSSQVQFFHAIGLIKWIFYPPEHDVDKGIDQIVSWAEKARESGYLVLENIAIDEKDVFISKGLNMMVDGMDINTFRTSLDLDLDLYREHNLRSANIFEAMGGYSPTIGILGAVHAMGSLDNPELLGQGIATAFVATIYGVGFANLIYIPVANKIKGIVHEQTMYREMIAEGLVSIANADNPHAIATKLSAFRLKE